MSIRINSAVSLCGLAAGLSYTVLAIASHVWERPPLWIFFACTACAAAAMIAAFRSLALSQKAHAYRELMLWPVLFRVIGFFGNPLYEDDYSRSQSVVSGLLGSVDCAFANWLGDCRMFDPAVELRHG